MTQFETITIGLLAFLALSHFVGDLNVLRLWNRDKKYFELRMQEASAIIDSFKEELLVHKKSNDLLSLELKKKQDELAKQRELYDLSKSGAEYKIGVSLKDPKKKGKK